MERVQAAVAEKETNLCKENKALYVAMLISTWPDASRNKTTTREE